MKKGLLLGLICLLTLCGCGEIPKLQNGEEAVITFAKDDKEHKISAEELFNELKENFGLEATLKVIDTYILESEFKDYQETAKENASSYIDAMLESYESEQALLNDIIANTNYNSIEGYEEYLYLSFMQSNAVTEYAKKQITDKEIEKYYKDEVKGDVEVYHILITPDVTDDMKSDEKTKAEEAAKTKAQDIIKRLNESDDALKTFKKLVKEYSEDDATKKKDGNLGFINYGDLDQNYDELIDAAYKLKDIKDEIIETLANELLSTDTQMTVNAMKYYRELYDMKIVDSELDRQYGIYLNNLINRQTNTEEE